MFPTCVVVAICSISVLPHLSFSCGLQFPDNAKRRERSSELSSDVQRYKSDISDAFQSIKDASAQLKLSWNKYGIDPATVAGTAPTDLPMRTREMIKILGPAIMPVLVSVPIALPALSLAELSLRGSFDEGATELLGAALAELIPIPGPARLIVPGKTSASWGPLTCAFRLAMRSYMHRCCLFGAQHVQHCIV